MEAEMKMIISRWFYLKAWSTSQWHTQVSLATDVLSVYGVSLTFICSVAARELSVLFLLRISSRNFSQGNSWTSQLIEIRHGQWLLTYSSPLPVCASRLTRTDCNTQFSIHVERNQTFGRSLEMGLKTDTNCKDKLNLYKLKHTQKNRSSNFSHEHYFEPQAESSQLSTPQSNVVTIGTTLWKH